MFILIIYFDTKFTFISRAIILYQCCRISESADESVSLCNRYVSYLCLVALSMAPFSHLNDVTLIITNSPCSGESRSVPRSERKSRKDLLSSPFSREKQPCSKGDAIKSRLRDSPALRETKIRNWRFLRKN